MSLPSIKPNRPTISLALIAKNEEHNLPRLLDSVSGCFDEIVLVDTGSTDKTKEIGASYGCVVHDFVWVDSFCTARNFAFSKTTCDFVMWLDCDDILYTKEAFIKWRDYAMQYQDCSFAAYDYVCDKDLNPLVSFVRERVFRKSINPVWQYDIHEGIIAKAEWSKNYATPWRVKHLRSDEDVKADRSRNIRIIEGLVSRGEIDGRMQFYYGKELFEANRPEEAVAALEKAIEMPQEAHDRILGLQYAGYACMVCFDKSQSPEEKIVFANKALDFAHKGIRIEPNRAEFYIMVGDVYIRSGQIHLAIPYFSAAKGCLKNFDSPYAQPLYSFKNLYGEAPSIQLAKIYAHLGLLDKSEKEARECLELYKNPEAQTIIDEVTKVARITNVKNNQIQVDDIVFTCPPQNVYEFDEEMFKNKTAGGSETALIMMAKSLKEKTGRRVLVFNMRENDLLADSGVEYVSNKKISEYFSRFKPTVHIAWRHNMKLTDAPTYLWCHDLFTPTVEQVHHFDKFLALTNFHKNYTQGLQGVPEEKIIVTRNGIIPERFNKAKVAKNPNKIVWMSSPDRGLDRAMPILDLVRAEFPEVELHVFYGIEHLHKYGPEMAGLGLKLKKMMDDRPWVKYHGATEQTKMHKMTEDAAIWLHPCSFIETSCITAMECLANGIFPITRYLGGLQDTLSDAESKRQAIMIKNHDWNDEAYWHKQYANAVCRVILNKQWENIDYDIEKNSWPAVADEWIQFMQLTPLKKESIA